MGYGSHGGIRAHKAGAGVTLGATVGASTGGTATPGPNPGIRRQPGAAYAAPVTPGGPLSAHHALLGLVAAEVLWLTWLRYAFRHHHGG